jgi:hypothetical protein
MPVLADDDVIVHGNAEPGRDLDDRLIGLRWRRIAGGVVVQKAISCTDGWMPLFATASSNFRRRRGALVPFFHFAKVAPGGGRKEDR